MTNVANFTAGLPVPTHLDMLERRALGVQELYFERYKNRSLNLTEAKQFASELKVAIDGLPSLRRDLEAANRPATKRELADHLSILMIAFGRAKWPPEGFATVLANYVGAAQPSLLALEWGVRHLITQPRDYPPYPADVLKSIEYAELRFSLVQTSIEGLPERLAAVTHRIAHLERFAKPIEGQGGLGPNQP